MSTTSEQTPGAPAPEDHDFDEQTGVYGFFRRHQKKLLYTAGLFTLLTFSISGPVMSWFDSMFNGAREQPKIVVNGKSVDLTTDDIKYGQMIAKRDSRGLPPGVLLPIMSQERNDSTLGEDYAILRRAAIEEGLGISFIEVDRAITAAQESAKLESPAKLAVARGFPSLAEYRIFVGEAMRVGLYMRLQLLAIDSSDATAMQRLLHDREKITFEAAVFDEEARIEALKAEKELTEEELREWLDTQDDRQKARLLVYDLPLAKLRLFALNYAEGQFDPSQWQEDVLKDFAISEEQLQSYYDSMKDLLFKDENDDYTPFEDDTVQAQLTRVVQAERVMNELLGKARDALAEQLKPIDEQLATLRTESGELKKASAEADDKKEKADRALDDARQELVAKPDDPELANKVTTLESERDTAVGEADTARDAMRTNTEALETAQEAQKDARSGFDLMAALAGLTEGKSGFVQKDMAEMANADALGDLDELGLELGKWPTSTQGTSFKTVGDICPGPARTSKAIALFQAVELDPQPLKAWEDLGPLLTDAYWSEKVTEEGRDKKTAMEEALLRLAKEHMTDFVTSLEGERETRVDTKVTEWQEGVEQEIAKAEEMLANPKIGNKARTAWQRTLDAKKRELQGKEGRVKSFAGTVDKEIESEIKDESKRHYSKVLAAAAEEAGFAFETLGPLPRDINTSPRFTDKHDDATVYLWNEHSELDEGEAIDVTFADGSRNYVVAVCTKAEPLTIDDITRREFELVRGEFSGSLARRQENQVRFHAFSHEALLERYELTRPKGTQEETAGQ